MREHIIIAVSNQKGGVGKTTTTLNLGAALAALGKKVLVVDNDIQGSLTLALGYTPATLTKTLANLINIAIDYPEDLETSLPEVIQPTTSGMDLLPANSRLGDAAIRLQMMQFSHSPLSAEIALSSEKIMRAILTPLLSTYDYILIDCGLKHEILTINALVAADYCILPVQAHYLASEGIPEVLRMIRFIREKLNPDLKVAGILLTMYQSRPVLCQEVHNTIKETYGCSIPVFQRPIEYSIRVAESPAAGKSILTYEPKNPAARSYRCLAEEVLHFE